MHQKVAQTRCLIVPLTFAAASVYAGQAFAQGAFVAPLPERDACAKEFVLLREEAEKHGKLIKAASERRAPPDEACELIGNFGQSEIKMIKYIEANSACGIPPEIADRLKAGHKNTEAMQKKVCAVARQAQLLAPASPGLGGVLGPLKREPAGPVGGFDDIGAPPLVR
jgi:hypothetical protein